MNSIRPLSFGTTDASSWQSKIREDQKYKQPSPQAASGVKGYYDEPEKKHTFLKILGVAAGVAALLGIGAKQSWFNADKVTNETAKKCLGHLDKAGNYIANTAINAFNRCKDIVTGLFKKTEKAAEATGEAAAEAGQKVADAVENAAEKAKETVQNIADKVAEEGTKIVEGTEAAVYKG